AVQADARDAAAVEAMVATVRDGLGPIDVLVINASIGFPVTPFLEYRWEDFQAKLLGEMGAAFHACKAVVPYMAARESGSIVAVTSGLARHPGWGFSAHTAAKAALEGFVRALSFELGPIGIRVNSVAPGLTITDATQNIPDERKTAAAEHTPLRRNGLPEDIAEAVVSLAGSSFISGVTVSVNGGSYVF
ncbi:MAG: SDR family oxidoreductase, partial [Thermoanaerobaculia bacterium]